MKMGALRLPRERAQGLRYVNMVGIYLSILLKTDKIYLSPVPMERLVILGESSGLCSLVYPGAVTASQSI